MNHATRIGIALLAAALGCQRGGSSGSSGGAPAREGAAAPASAPASEPAPDPKWKEVTVLTKPATPDGVTEAKLGNGLRILVQEMHDVPVVTAMVWYRVGSANEKDGATGLSHYLEHLMFKGTDKLKKGEIDDITLRNGGANNAFTSQDYTAYYFDFASDRWEVALEVEANRMRRCAFDPKEFQAEKKVVLEELKINLDSPDGKLERKIEETLFAGLPYRHHVLGTLGDVTDRVDQDVVKTYYDRHYWPANATVVVVGDVKTDRVLSLVAERFGGIAPGTPPDPLPPTRAAPPGDKRVEVRQLLEIPRFTVGYPTVRTGDPEDYVLDVTRQVLVGGKSSKLYRRLVDGEKLATDVSAWNDSRRLPGAFFVGVEPKADADRARLEALVAEEIARLGKEPVSDAELSRAKNLIVASFVFEKETAHNRASALGYYDTIANWRLFETYVPRIEAVTAADVQRVAGQFLVPKNRITGWALPPEEGAKGGGGGGGGARRSARPDGSRDRGHFRSPLQSAGGAAGEVPALPVRRFTLGNGLKLLVLPRKGAPIVALRAFVDADRRHEPKGKAGLAALAGELLREGTGTRTALEISEAIEGVGGEFDTSPTGVTARVRTPNLDLALDLAADVLQHATIPEEAFARKRDEQLSNIRSEMDEPRTIAQRAMQALAYGDHPYANPPLGTLESVQALTRDDVAAYVRRFVVPGNTLLAIAGDGDAEDVRKRVEARFAGWAGDPPTADPIPEPAPQAEPRRRFVGRPQDEQLNIYLGRVGVRRTNPDWYALLVMDYVLGTGPGFTDRLSKTLRDEMGLAYTVGSRIAENAGIEPGLFSAYIGTSPVNKLKAIYGIRYEIARIRDEPVSDAELAGAKAYLTGSFVFQLQTRAQLAEHLVASERYGLGDDYIRRYPLLVNAVTAEDVRRVARKYLDPENATLAIVGRVDEDGFTTPAPPGDDGK